MLYDMHGNVWEIVNDRYANYPSGNVTDPTEPETGEDLDKAGRDLVKQTGVELRSNRVFRGGSGSSDAERCRSANRNGNTPSRRSSACGFRVAMSPSALDQLASLQESRSGIGKVSQNAVEFISGQGDGVFQNSLGLFFKKIPAGSIKTSNGLAQTENKVVNIAQPFLIGMHEVTQDQFNLVMGENPSKFRGKSNPVESVTWFDAIEFCKRLSSKTEEQRSGNFYRLPTSDEWQLACRAGTSTKYFFGDSEKDLGRFAWYSFGNQGNTWARDNTHTTHRPIGQKLPNNFGLYDMLGNVQEWSQDQLIEGLRLRSGGSHHEVDLEPYLRTTNFATQIPLEETDKDEFTGFRVVLEPRGSGDRGLGVAAQERFENYLSGKTPGSPDAKDLAEREKETLSSNKSTKGHSPSGSRPTSKVPARYQGLWRTRAVSFDGGKTTKQANDLPPFVYVDGDKVQSRVSGQPDRRVVSVKESSGGCHFVLDNNLVWTLADTDEGVTLLIVFAPGGKEMIRHLVVIQSKTVRSSPKPSRSAVSQSTRSPQPRQNAHELARRHVEGLKARAQANGDIAEVLEYEGIIGAISALQLGGGLTNLFDPGTRSRAQGYIDMYKN
jgi:formylglycine-generating enzyme required for sulfatase activity